MDKSLKKFDKSRTSLSGFDFEKNNKNNNPNIVLTENEKNEKYSTDISLSRLFLHKRNNYFTERGLLKQICISPKDIVSNVNESYDYFQKMKKNKNLGDLKNAKIYDTIQRFEHYKDKCKEISRSLTRNHQRKTMKKIDSTINSKEYFQKSKVKEMGAILSNNTLLKNETQIFKNLVRELKFYFAEDYDIISEYFKINSNLIKNEGRQIKFFHIALDLIQQILEVYQEKNINNVWDIAIELYNSLFEDFREHLSSNSLNRANFLYKLWNFKQEQIDKKISKINESLNDYGMKIESLNEKNSRLLEEINNSNKKNEIVENEKIKLKNDNKRLKLSIPEKDKRIEDLEHIISDLNENLQKKIDDYCNLLNKYNARIQGKKILRVSSHNLFENDDSTSKMSFNDIDDGSISNSEKTKKKLSNKIVPKISLKNGIGEENIYSNAIKNEENERRNKLLRNVINKQKRKENENNENKNIFERKISSFGRDLKSKIQLTSNYLNDLQKVETNPKIFTEEIDIDKGTIKEVNELIIPNEKIKQKKDIEQLDLYMNKGVENIERYKDQIVQTEIQGTGNLNISNNVFNELIDNLNDSESKNKLAQILNEYDLKVQETIKLREDLEKFQDTNEQIVETYNDIVTSYKDTMKNSNDVINDYLLENETKLNENGYFSFVDLLHNLIDKINKTINENQVSDMYDFGTEYANNIKRGSLTGGIELKVEEILNYNKNNNKNEEKKKKTIRGRRRSSIFDANKIQQARMKAFQKRSEIDFNKEKFNYENIFQDFLGRKKEIKLSMTLRKVLRNVDSILFDFIEQVYFRKEKLNFSKDERYLDFGEAVYFYFLKSFGVEKLVQKKYIAFLRGLFEYEKENGRVNIFLNLLQIKRYEFDEKKKNYIRRSSTDNDYFYNYYSNFISRQIILTIQFLRVNNFIVKVLSEQGIIVIYIKYQRLSESLISHFSNFHITQEIKEKINNGIEKNKKSVEKVMHQVILFEKLIEILYNVFTIYEQKFTSTLRVIFHSFCHDEHLNKLEYLTLNEYLLGHKVNYELLDKLFSVGKEVNMDFEKFETNVIELDNLDINKFHNFLNIDTDQVKKILLHLKEIINANQLTILDKIINRLKLVKYKQIADFFIDKTNQVKYLISVIKDEDFDVEHFLSIKILDKVSKFLYQDNRVTEIFGGLEKIHNLISVYNQNEMENYLLSYIKSKNLK